MYINHVPCTVCILSSTDHEDMQNCKAVYQLPAEWVMSLVEFPPQCATNHLQSWTWHGDRAHLGTFQALWILEVDSAHCSLCIVWSMPTSSNICSEFAVTSSFLLLVSPSCSGPISCCHVSLGTARCKRLVRMRKSWRTGSTSGRNDDTRSEVILIYTVLYSTWSCAMNPNLCENF